MHKILSVCFGFGITGAVVSTWIAPRVISMLVTPPVSFSTNCDDESQVLFPSQG
jgi:hypothetical protein